MLLKEKDEIKAFLSKAAQPELGQLWQTIGIRRDIYKIIAMDVLEDGIIFMTSAPLELDEKHPVYINVNYKNFIFKLHKGDYKYAAKQLTCRYPEEAKAIESRRHPRTKIPKRGNITLTLRSTSADTALDAKMILHDISEGGVGGSVNIINADFFQRNNIFKVVKICEKTVKEDSLLHLRFVRVNPKSGRVTLGFSLTKPLSSRFHEILYAKLKENMTS